MTADEINALPEKVRLYIHELETNTDPAGTIREVVLLREENEMLRELLGEMLLRSIITGTLREALASRASARRKILGIPGTPDVQSVL